MTKKDKFAPVFTGILLFLTAALFSISILVSALELGTEESFLYLFGNLLTSVYGFCSALIPVFLFTAGAFCFAENWTVKKACILLVSLIPFFTLVFSEHIIRTISESDSSPAAAMKIFTVVSIAVLLVIAEFLLAVVLAEHFHDKLAKIKLPESFKKNKKSDDDVEIIFDDESESEKETASNNKDDNTDEEEENESGTSSAEDTAPEKIKGADSWDLTSVLEKNRMEIQKNTAEAQEKRASKYDSIWDLDENGEIKDLHDDDSDKPALTNKEF